VWNSSGDSLTIWHWIICACLASLHNKVVIQLVKHDFKGAQSTIQSAFSLWQRGIQKGEPLLRDAFIDDAQSVAHLLSLYNMAGKTLLDMANVSENKKGGSDAPTCYKSDSKLYEGAVQQFKHACWP